MILASEGRGGELYLQAHLDTRNKGLTKEAFEAAATWASLVEIDVQVARDGAFILYHHYTLPDGRWVHETDQADCWAALQAMAQDDTPLRHLDEVVELAADLDVKLCLDLKSGFGPDHRVHERIAEWLHAVPDRRDLHVSDWDHRGLHRIKDEHPHVLVRGAIRGRLHDTATVARAARLDGLNLAWDCTRPNDVASLHEQGLVVAFFGGWGDRYTTHASDCDVDILIADGPP